MDQNLDQIKNNYLTKINSVTTDSELEQIRIAISGRNGLINDLFSKIKDIAPENKKQYGADLNQLKIELEQKLKEKNISPLNQKEISTRQDGFKNKNVYSLPKIGHLHPISQTERQLNEIFKKLGFSIYNSPEIVTDEFNFERLNVPKDHPARDMQDSIYIKEPEYLLRTQTSTIEAYLLAQKTKELPLRAAFAGSTFRNEKVNRSNHFVFHQYQAVVIDKNVTMKDLIGTMDLMFKTLYGPDVVVRYDCKYYPEVEPGVGPNMQCFNCHGKGCPLCKYAGWIEMGGAGMIHPKVLEMAGIDPKIWSGFAFGMGLDRWTMAQKNIKDIRTLMGGNLAYKPNEL
ncbi:MAG: phenylalanine--tRNA ligase subunit alpha [Candidatus Shapirobacteria bacterium]|jgi:phenylalanyl-tRNA synthetase alpha chain